MSGHDGLLAEGFSQDARPPVCKSMQICDEVEFGRVLWEKPEKSNRVL
jgi:hypothetical protein